MSHKITLLALLVGTSAALAQGWADHSGAFPLLPCQDGWAGCRVAGATVSPALRADRDGLPVPSDMRLGWWDLEPTPAFSPFVELSRYAGDPPAVVAVDRPDVEPEPEPEPPVEPGGSDEPRQLVRESDEPRQLVRESDDPRQVRRPSDEPRQVRRPSDEPRQVTRGSDDPRQVTRGSDEPRQVTRPGGPRSPMRPGDDGVADAADPRDRRSPRDASPPDAPRQGPADGPAAVDATVKQVAAAVAEPTSCEPSELVKLEPQAMLGKMSPPQIKLCEDALAAASKMTDKDKISRVLMVNAFAKGDKATWERLVKRHLDEIDQSDPELCYKYAVHLSKAGPSRAAGVIRWANTALDNRTVWQGDTYTSRVYTLYKLRAAAAQQLWQSAEKAHAAEPSDATRKKAEEYRAQTKVLAREWYEYAKVAGKDTTTALQLCMSAAGTADYCEAG